MEQSFVLAVQITEELFNILDIHLDRRRQNVRIIAGLGCFFLLIDLHLFNIGELFFDEFQGIDLIKRLNMDVHAEQILHFDEIPENLIRQLTGKDIHTPYSAVGIADLKICLIEFQRRRTDKILCVHSCADHGTPVKDEWGIAVRIHGVIHRFKTLFAVKQFCFDTKCLETLDHIVFDAHQLCPCRLIRSAFDPECQEFTGRLSVAAFEQLIRQHFAVFLADCIEIIVLFRNLHCLYELCL